jgi:hypothetical protein
VLELIKKLPYDITLKQRFVKRVNNDLFDKHRSFLSIPLLATMMLITFDQFADIPNKMHLFYEQAFDALFSKHDATKEGYKRQMHTDCQIDQFKRHLSYFCLGSYYDEKFEFSETEALNYVVKGLKVEGVAIEPSLFLQDLVESVCMLQKDGFAYTFTHRSFQEFFAAYNLVRVNRGLASEVFKKVMRRRADVVLKMSFDMDKELVEAEFVVPNLRKLCLTLGDVSSPEVFAKYFVSVYGRYEIHVLHSHVKHLWTENPNGLLDFVDTLGQLYPGLFLDARPDLHEAEALRILLQRNHRKISTTYWSAVFGIDESGQAVISLREKPGGQTYSESSDPAPWLGNTPFAKSIRRIATNVSHLLGEIERNQRHRVEALDALLGLK